MPYAARGRASWARLMEWILATAGWSQRAAVGVLRGEGQWLVKRGEF
jgi:hypothetical protein